MAGGTNKGYRIATDSNYDWGGQDLTKLDKWTEERQIDKIYTHLFTASPYKYYLGDKYENYDVLTHSIPPIGSYVAISAHVYQTELNTKPELKNKYFNENNIIDKVGKSIFIFKIE